MIKPKFVIDTNVIISALLIKQSISRQALDKALGQGITGNAACIITGDKDLLVLHPFKNIDILTPDLFLESYL